MVIIEIGTLNLRGFDKTNKEHVEFYKRLVKDNNITSRFQGIGVGLLHDHGDSFFDRGFLLAEKEKLIGYLEIGDYNTANKYVYLKGAIDEYNRGKSYGKTMLKEITNYIFTNYSQVESIRLTIAKDNIASRKVAESCGYQLLYDEHYIQYNPYINELECRSMRFN